MAGLPHNQLGPLMGALREQKADIMDAMDVLHSNMDHPGQGWDTQIPFGQSTLRKLLTEHVETIDHLETFMLTEGPQGLSCWSELRMAQQEGEFLMETVSATIQKANTFLWDMEFLGCPDEVTTTQASSEAASHVMTMDTMQQGTEIP